MIDQRLIVALLLYLTAAIYFLAGIYIIQTGRKKENNRILFLLCMTAFVWAFSFAMMTFALEYKGALLWHRISSFGWSFFYAILLHFILEISNSFGDKKKYFKLIIYLPAIVLIYVFGINSELAARYSQLTYTNFGWTYSAAVSFWDIVYNTYFLSYIGIIILLLINWRKRIEGRYLFNPASAIIVSIIVAAALGALTDIIAIDFGLMLPLMGVIITTIPAGVTFIVLRKYGFLQDRIRLSINLTDVKEKDLRENIYSLLSLYLISGALFDFGMRFFVQGYDFIELFIFNTIIIIISFALNFIVDLQVKQKKQDLLTTFIVSLVMFSLLIRYADKAAMTLWPIFIIIIMILMLLKNKLLIITASLFAVVAQIFIALSSNNKVVLIESYDYIARFGIILLATLIALYANKLYQDKDELNQKHIRNSNLILEISNNFLTLNSNNYQEKTCQALAMCEKAYDLDGSFLLSFDDQQEKLSYSYG